MLLRTGSAHPAATQLLLGRWLTRQRLAARPEPVEAPDLLVGDIRAFYAGLRTEGR